MAAKILWVLLAGLGTAIGWIMMNVAMDKDVVNAEARMEKRVLVVEQQQTEVLKSLGEIKAGVSYIKGYVKLQEREDGN